MKIIKINLVEASITKIFMLSLFTNIQCNNSSKMHVFKSKQTVEECIISKEKEKENEKDNDNILTDYSQKADRNQYDIIDKNDSEKKKDKVTEELIENSLNEYKNSNSDKEKGKVIEELLENSPIVYVYKKKKKRALKNRFIYRYLLAYSFCGLLGYLDGRTPCNPAKAGFYNKEWMGISLAIGALCGMFDYIMEKDTKEIFRSFSEGIISTYFCYVSYAIIKNACLSDDQFIKFIFVMLEPFPNNIVFLTIILSLLYAHCG